MIQNFKTRLFITGIYRSGTTLISRILDNNSKIWVTFDSVHFMRFSFERYNPIQKFKNAERLVKETKKRMSKRWGMDFDSDSVLERVNSFKRIEYSSVYDSIMGVLIKQYKKSATSWGEKTNVCWGKIPSFISMFPEGKVIHVIRDPRDVMCSYREMTYEPGYSYLDSAFCSLGALQKAQEYTRTFNRNNYYILKYEDFLKNPQKGTKTLCEFLNIDFEPKMLEVNKFTDKSGKWWNGDSSFQKKMTAISTKPIDRWKKSANDMEIFFVEMINRDAMRSFGYKLLGIDASKSDWNKLHKIIHENTVLKARYSHWLKTGEEIEGLPSDPLKK